MTRRLFTDALIVVAFPFSLSNSRLVQEQHKLQEYSTFAGCVGRIPCGSSGGALSRGTSRNSESRSALAG